jgi:tight adherence protein C
MILFFLPVLFAIILGPAIIQVGQQGGLFGKDEKTMQE